MDHLNASKQLNVQRLTLVGQKRLNLQNWVSDKKPLKSYLKTYQYLGGGGAAAGGAAAGGDTKMLEL